MSIMLEGKRPLYEDWGPRYDLSDEEMQTAIMAEVLSRDNLPAGRFVGLVANEGPLCDVGRTIERRVFEESFSNDNNVMQREYGAYDATGSRRFLLVIDTQKQCPAGVVGIVENSSAGLKTLNDAEKPQYVGVAKENLRTMHGIDDLNTCWDVGTLAVPREYRGKGTGLEVSTMLYRMFFLLGKEEGIKDIVAMIDSGAYRNMHMLGVPFRPMANSKPFEYLGSPESRAVYGKFDAFWPSVSRRAKMLGVVAKAGRLLSNLTGIESRKVKKIEMAARAAGMLAVGTGLDEHIMLSA